MLRINFKSFDLSNKSNFITLFALVCEQISFTNSSTTIAYSGSQKYCLRTLDAVPSKKSTTRLTIATTKNTRSFHCSSSSTTVRTFGSETAMVTKSCRVSIFGVLVKIALIRLTGIYFIYHWLSARQFPFHDFYCASPRAKWILMWAFMYFNETFTVFFVFFCFALVSCFFFSLLI